MKLYILMKCNVLSLVDSSEHFLFSFQLAKTFGNTSFVSVKYQFSSEFFQIGMPHFSLEGVCPVIILKDVHRPAHDTDTLAEQKTKYKSSDFKIFFFFHRALNHVGLNLTPSKSQSL